MRATTAIVLAAGLSRRMGTPKLLLPVGPKIMLQHTLDLIAGFPFSRTILVTLPAILEKVETSARIVINERPEAGQSLSVRLGVSAAEPGDSLLFLTGDQPFLERETLAAILEADDGSSIVCPQGPDGIPQSPNLFPPRFRQLLLGLTADQGGRQIRGQYPNALKPVPIPNAETLLDVDSLEDYKHILALSIKTEG